MKKEYVTPKYSFSLMVQSELALNDPAEGSAALDFTDIPDED